MSARDRLSLLRRYDWRWYNNKYYCKKKKKKIRIINHVVRPVHKGKHTAMTRRMEIEREVMTASIHQQVSYKHKLFLARRRGGIGLQNNTERRSGAAGKSSCVCAFVLAGPGATVHLSRYYKHKDKAYWTAGRNKLLLIR